MFKISRSLNFRFTPPIPLSIVNELILSGSVGSNPRLGIPKNIIYHTINTKNWLKCFKLILPFDK